MDIKLLDCTLRDGGYVVDAKFGAQRIRGIIERLEKARVDIIECGFLRSNEHKSDESIFHLPSEVDPYLPDRHTDETTYALMYDCGRYDVASLPNYSGGPVCGIRDCFHKEFRERAVAEAKLLIDKGYQTFIQPTGIVGYSERELLDLIHEVNKLKPYGFSLVDTFGSMYRDDLKRLLQIVLDRLSPDIYLGFHSHNNRQLSFALSQDFLDICSEHDRNCIVDATLYGMGRGAGNTNTELVMDYLNQKYRKQYDIDETLDLMDLYLKHDVAEHKWGYSLPYFIAGQYCSHVDNISYLNDKGNVPTKDLRKILSMMQENERKHFHPEILDELYSRCLTLGAEVINSSQNEQMLRERFAGKIVLLVAPGKTAVTERNAILAYISASPEVVPITLNFIDKDYSSIAFFGNIKRFDVWRQLEPQTFSQTFKIVTSNVASENGKNLIAVSQGPLLQTGWKHFDLSSIMALRLLAKLGVRKIVLAGMDGFSMGPMDDHFVEIMNTYLPASEYALIDQETIEMLGAFYNENCAVLDIEFLTPSVYECAILGKEK